VTGAEKERESLELRDLLRDAGVLVFGSSERAARAFANVVRHRRG
jgi:acyl-CoA synthetase (NDP forming)